MIDCTSIGDQIAAALAVPLTCEVRAAPDLTSSRIINLAYGSGTYHRWCIVSAGTNDPPDYARFERNLNDIRTTALCKYFVWIIPDNDINHVVINVAREYNDITVQNNSNTVALAQSVINATGN